MIKNDSLNYIERQGVGNDSLYTFDICSFGEFGSGSIFTNRKTNQSYGYPAFYPTQIIPFKGKYIVANFYDIGRSDFQVISDPKKLFRYPPFADSTLGCRWYNDSVFHYDIKEDDTLRSVKHYSGTPGMNVLITFPYKNSLYSIISNNLVTILAKHVDFKLNYIDTLLDRPLYCNVIHPKIINDSTILATGYSTSPMLLNKNNVVSHYSVVIFIQNNKLEIAETGIPVTRDNKYTDTFLPPLL